MTFQDEVARFTAALQATLALPDLQAKLDATVRIIRASGLTMVCGNGGSAADAAHLCAELIGYFTAPRRDPLPVVNLCADPVFLTAWANDAQFATVFARQVRAYRDIAGCLICISTSGNSENVISAAREAKRHGIPVVALTGGRGGALGKYADVLLEADATETAIVQQVHQCMYHWLCGALDRVPT